MARQSFSLRFESNLSIFTNLIKAFPALKLQLMTEIGYQGRRLLYENFEQGQVIDLRAYPTDRDGKRTASYSVQKKGNAVKISSYPLNLYNPRSVYSAARSQINGKIPEILNAYEKKILQKEIDRLDKKK